MGILDIIKEKMKKEKEPKELVLRIQDIEKKELEKLEKKGQWIELAKLMKENMELRKENEKLRKLIGELKNALEKKKEEELLAQKKYLEQVKKQREFTIWMAPEKPIMAMSAFTNEGFFGQDGKRRSYLVGIKLCHSPEIGPYIVPLLGKKPIKIKPKEERIALETRPPITLRSIEDVFADPMLLVPILKTKGHILLNITGEGYFVPNKIGWVSSYEK